MARIRATVVVLTYNGERYLREILEGIRAQRLVGEVEILIIDSGSTDQTLTIVNSFPNIRLHEIPNAEFGHGRTRNLAASLSRGEFVVFLTHDATPATDRWLHHILEPFEIAPTVMAVLGNQIPRPHCPPIMKYEIRGVFGRYGQNFSVHVMHKGNFAGNDQAMAIMGFYSDVNSAVRRTFIRDVIPYRDVRYAEDQLFGRELIELGYRKAFAPLAAVVHSNDLNMREYRYRIFDETIGLREVGSSVPVYSSRWRLARIVRGALGDTLRVIHDPDAAIRWKIRWLFINPWFHVVKWRAYHRASTVPLDDLDAIASESLERYRKVPFGERAAQ
jgi:rhamnosyltransferase